MREREGEKEREVNIGGEERVRKKKRGKEKSEEIDRKRWLARNYAYYSYYYYIIITDYTFRIMYCITTFG